MNPGCSGRSLRIRTSSQATRAFAGAALLLLATVGIACSSDGGTTGSSTGNGNTTSGGTGGASNGTGAGGSSSTGTGGSATGTGTGKGTGGSTGGATTGTGAGGATTTTGSGGSTSGGTTTGTGGAGTTTTTGTGTGGAGTTGGTTTGTGGAGTTTTTGTGGAGGAGTGGAGGVGGTGTGGAGGGPSVDAGSPDGGAQGCNLNTGYDGDDQCLLPPPPDKGFQIHIGPKDYKNPEATYLLQPGQEVTTDGMMAGNSPNTSKAYFFYRQYRMRPTAHHVIVSAPNGSDVGRRIGTANKSEDYPVNGVIAPEDKNVGIPIDPNTPITVSFHAINTKTKPQLREFWMNFWYRDPAEVTQPAIAWFETGNVSFAIPPHTKTTIGPNTCTVSGNGRMLWTYGHRHASNTRFQMTRIRGTQRDLFYDSYTWEHPLLLEFNTITKNKAPDPANMAEGGWNGILDLITGDKIEWTCDINNTTDGTLRFTNNTYTGEMCIIDAEAVGSNCQ